MSREPIEESDLVSKPANRDSYCAPCYGKPQHEGNDTGQYDGCDGPASCGCPCHSEEVQS